MKLMEHQRKAVATCLRERSYALFMATGTGKTATMLTVASELYLQGKIDTLLVIAPKGVHKQWVESEAPLWTTVPYAATWKTDKALPPVKSTHLTIIAVNIDVFSTKDKWEKYVKRTDENTMVVIDECTSIKTPSALRTKRVMFLSNKAGYKYVLTGTPVTSGPYDVYQPIEFLQRGFWGCTYKLFQYRHGLWATMQINGRSIPVQVDKKKWHLIKACESYEHASLLYGATLETFATIKEQDRFTSPYRNIDKLISMLRMTSLFVKLEDCVDMPDKHYVVRKIAMGTTQAKAYVDMEKELMASGTISSDDDLTAISEASTKGGAYMKLRQICSGYFPISYTVDEEGEVVEEAIGISHVFKEQPKLDQLKIDIDTILGNPGVSEDKVLVFCNFTHEANMCYEAVEKLGYAASIITGTRKEASTGGDALQEFIDGNTQVLIANTKVMAKGFNLQENCCHSIYYSSTWSLEDRLQSEARTFRLGQKNKCVYIDYRMTTPNGGDTIEMRISDNQKVKRELFEKVREEGVTWQQ